jgi:hypothetical protein
MDVMSSSRNARFVCVHAGMFGPDFEPGVTRA